MKKVTTISGAVYYLHAGGKITGGSKEIVDGTLLNELMIGCSMLISAPERAHVNPHFEIPGVTTSYVVSIEEVEDAIQ